MSSDPLSPDMSHSKLASEALYSVAPPALAPENLGAMRDNYANGFPPDFSAQEQEPAHAKSSWLDAMPVDDEYELNGEYLGISAVNSDDNGLYRLFVGVSP